MRLLVVSLAFLLAMPVLAQDKKAEDKKKPAAKSEKNVFQKTESAVGDWAHRNKVWMRKESKNGGGGDAKK
jgi:hypothetical protein